MSKMRSLPVVVLSLVMLFGVLTILPATSVKAVNPYLPLWEHVPDGEPRVFEDPDNPGKYRAYIFGSHDVRRHEYCGPDVRAWSAPVEDLSDWRDEGSVFKYKSGNNWDLIYAPDVIEVVRKDGKKEYYLFPHSMARSHLVSKSDRPTGPFTEHLNVSSGILGFDPSGYVEQITDPNDPDFDIGFRAYAYWGATFQASKSRAVELENDDSKPNFMFREREGTQVINNFMPCSKSYGNLADGEPASAPAGTTNLPNTGQYPHIFLEENLLDFNLFEASSIRKVGNKYIMIFSGYSGPDYGMGGTNSAMRWCYGDSPLGPWKFGGVLVDSRGPVPNQNGDQLVGTNWGHNTHGSIELINDQWYTFYHRPPRGYNGARQTMVGPIKIDWEEKSVADGGKVKITAYDPYSDDNTWTAKDSRGREYSGVEVTSEGFDIFGLDPYKYYSAGIVCYSTGDGQLRDAYDIWNNHAPIGGITQEIADQYEKPADQNKNAIRNNYVAGFKYFGFGGLEKAEKGVKAFEGTAPGNNTKLNLFLTPKSTSAFNVEIWMDGPWDNDTWKGIHLGTINVPADSPQETTRFTSDVLAQVDAADKKHAIYLRFTGPANTNLCDFIGLGFSSDDKPLSAPIVPELDIQVNGESVELPVWPVRSTAQNGITGYDIYETTYTGDTLTEIPTITASSNVKDVKITILEPTSEKGMSLIRFDYKGVVKSYWLKLSSDAVFSPADDILAVTPTDIERIEDAVEIIGDVIKIDGAKNMTSNEKITKAKEALSKIKELSELDLDIEITENQDGTFTLLLQSGDATRTNQIFNITDITTHIITLNPTGGTLPDPSKASFEVNDGDKIGTLPTPSKSGYTFSGWYTAETGGSKINSETIVNASATYYAQYTAIAATSSPLPSTPTVSPTPPTNNDKVVGPVKGSSFNNKSIKYKITKQAIGKTPGTVQLTTPLNKKIKSVTIAATVKSGSFTYNVETIANNAFKGCKSLSKVTIGNKVVKIGSKAFSGAGKLKSIKITTKKLKSVGKNALKGIHKKAKIKVPSAKYSAYKKLLSGKGQRKTVKIKK